MTCGKLTKKCDIIIHLQYVNKLHSLNGGYLMSQNRKKRYGQTDRKISIDNTHLARVSTI